MRIAINVPITYRGLLKLDTAVGWALAADRMHRVMMTWIWSSPGDVREPFAYIVWGKA